MLPPLRLSTFVLVVLLSWSAAPALACACCTEKATRSIGTVELDESAPQRTILDELRFARTARLRTSADDRGLDDPSDPYTLEVRRSEGRFSFVLRDKKGRSGTLSWHMPKSLAYFSVDPDPQEADGGTGPTLYTEWTLKARVSGSGIFKAAGTDQRVTLIVHGRGGGCTEVGDFHAWTLEVEGPSASFALYGALASRRR